MRIAFHVPRASFLAAGYSGDRVLVAGLVAGLREQGHEVQIVSQVNARELGRRRVPAHRLVSEAIRVRRQMRRFAPEGWLVYNPSVTYPDLFGWWQRSARYVVFAADEGRPEHLPLQWRWLFTAAHHRSLRAADAITVFRLRGAARIRALGVEPERVVLLPPAVAPPKTPATKEEARRALELPVDVPVVLCVSRFTGRRQDGRPGKTALVLDLLGVVAALPPPVVCVIVGGGAGQSEIEETRAKLGLEQRVRLAGNVPDVYLYYAACDVFAYPYGLDRPWISVLEAQACGRPVVTMRTDSAELTVEDGRTGLLANDLDEFHAQLASLTADRARCESMGQAARDFIAGSHTIAIRVGQIEALLSGRTPGAVS